MEYQPAPPPTYGGPAMAAAATAAPMLSGGAGPADPRLGDPRPVAAAANPFVGTDVRSIRTACEFSLGEYVTLQKRARYDDPAGERRLRTQQGIVLSDLQALRAEVAGLARDAEEHRWRKWLVGGVVAAFIPAVRRIFRRSSADREANDTEYAFKRSKGLIARILSSVHGKSRIASVAFFVLSILYVFQSEVTLRVARTVSKRLKRLAAKVERGDQDIAPDDLKLLSGWRWRVLLW
ncbi:hypothetical protein GGR52DRAFT_571752 [Hypoxylon sp. FL1284]|nr:hypothetical protein GGR52DRAFT_571752 [Hypoxylon sp. FL1284]